MPGHDNVLDAATTASAVLNCEGALPKLVQLLSRTSDSAKLAGSLLTASAQVTLTQVPTLDEIKAVIDLVSWSLTNLYVCQIVIDSAHHATCL